MKNDTDRSLTILLPAGRLPLEIMVTAQTLASRYCLGIYLSTMQNLRLVDIPEAVVAEVREELIKVGAEFKGPDTFPIPRVCIGRNYCNMGIIDTEALSRKILEAFAERKKTKAKLKLAIAGCTLCCSGIKNADIGIMATREGLAIFVGGKGGSSPRVGKRIAQMADERRVIEILTELINFHDLKTTTKQRMYALLNDPEFPFQEV